MSLTALVLCSDEKIVRVLRRVLSELEISIVAVGDSDEAVRRLTRERFEAVIVDCCDQLLAAQVLKSARTAPCNKQAVAVALVDGQKAISSAFNLGAHFVLYKPISPERAKTSFRAARALMKRERRRNARVPVEIPVTLWPDGQSPIKTYTIDIGEGGVAVSLTQRPRGAKPMRIELTLPGSRYELDCSGEIAWENAKKQSGVRFVEISAEAKDQIKNWLATHSPDLEPDDPPSCSKLTDLSLGGCYLESASPFPVRTIVTLSMKVGEAALKVEGVVRVMHPEGGMGVQFTRHDQGQRANVEKFINSLASSGESVPDILVDPEGMLGEAQAASDTQREPSEDALLELFGRPQMSLQEFKEELVRQRSGSPELHSAAATV